MTPSIFTQDIAIAVIDSAPAVNTNPTSSYVVGCASVTSDGHNRRAVYCIPMTAANIPSPDAPLLRYVHDVLSERGAEAFSAAVGVPALISREALHSILVNQYGGRALAVGVKWRDEDPLQITGIVTCGPATLDSHWRLSAAFAPSHKVPVTLNVMQLAARLWFSTLGRQWPRSLSYRAVKGSVEARRILETLLVFHSKKPCERRHEFWASVTADHSDAADLTPLDVQLGAGSYGVELLEDLATWGVGNARWAVEGVPALSAINALPPSWNGFVLHSAELPMACRGFQHLTPIEREELLGSPIAELLNTIAVTQRAAIAKMRHMDTAPPVAHGKDSTSVSPARSASETPVAASLGWRDAGAATDEDEASWRSLFGVHSVSPQQTPSLTPRKDMSMLALP